MQRQRAFVGGWLKPGTALVVVCLAVVTLPPRSTAPTVAGCRLVGCSVVSGRPLRSRAVAGVSLHVCVCLGPVLASHAPSPPAAAAAAWRGLGRGVGVLGGPRAGVDGLWRLCCGVAVGGPFAGGRSSVFYRSQSLLVRWGDAWGCGGERSAAWASSGRGQLQQACGFTAV